MTLTVILTKTGMLPNVTQNQSARHFSNLCIKNVETEDFDGNGQLNEVN